MVTSKYGRKTHRTARDRAGYAARRARSLPAWKKLWELRQRGLRYYEIARMLGRPTSSVFKSVQNYEEHRLNLQRIEKNHQAA